MESNLKFIQLKRFLFPLLCLTFVNLLFGPLVRATDSGLACPDWPLCFGEFFPEFQFNIWMEVGHRIFSGFISLFLLVISYFILSNSELRKEFVLLLSIAIVLVFIQIILGMLTVTKLLNPTTVNFHLLTAILFFTTLVTLYLKLILQIKNEWNFKFQYIFQIRNILLIVLLISIYMQLYLGGQVSSNYAGLACPDFPTCYGSFFPKMEGIIRFQMEHRFGAYFIFILLIFALFEAFIQKNHRFVVFFLRVALYSLCLQFVLGMMNVYYKLPKLITALHTGVAVIIFISVYAALYLKINFGERE